MAGNKPKLPMDGFAVLAGAHSLEEIAKQPAPTDPRIKRLLGTALIEPEKLSPAEVREMAASIVYHLLATKKAIANR